MTTKQERLQHKIGDDIVEFRRQCHTLMMATTDTGQHPHVSYAPFVYTGGSYYVLVSDVAQHGQNLKHSPSLSIMLIEDESAAKSLYARRRLTFNTTATFIPRESEEWQPLIDDFFNRFGDIINNLSNLSDFNLYRLTVSDGRFVKGFGQAFTVSGQDEIDFVHLDQGHQKIS